MNKEKKFKASVQRYMYWKSDLRNNRRCCPKCGSSLEKEYHSYVVVSEINGERDSFISGNDNGRFCRNCPVVVLDKKDFGEQVLAATGGNMAKIAVTGIIDFDAVPENKRHLPLGGDDNPIPLVEFLDHRPYEGNNNGGEEIDEKDLLEKAVNCEFNNNFEEAEKFISRILSTNPTSYHALFLKYRINKKIGKTNIADLRMAYKVAKKQNANKEVLELMEDEIRGE